MYTNKSLSLIMSYHRYVATGRSQRRALDKIDSSLFPKVERAPSV